MKIIVCLKQVPESQDVRLDPVTHNLQREGVKSIINPFDLYALEAGSAGPGTTGRRSHCFVHGTAPG